MLRRSNLVWLFALLSGISLVSPAPSAAHYAAPQSAATRYSSGSYITLPADRDTAILAAVVYAEAQASPVVFQEMLAIASAVRNRVDHVAAYPADISSFGGPGYHGVVSRRDQFPSYRSPRYRRFMSRSLGSTVEANVAQQAIRAAVQVRQRGASHRFIFFQQARVLPSPRAANPPMRLGAHHFWSFRHQCVNPSVPCRR